MPRLNVIILDQHQDDPNTWNAVLWADVPTARQVRYANPDAKSAWSGATAADNTNLQNGSVVELLMAQRTAAGTTLAQLEALLQTQWTNYQSSITSYNPWRFSGTNWDGTTWTQVNNG